MHVCLHTSSVITSETYLYVALPNMFNLHPAARIPTPSELSTPTVESLFFSTVSVACVFQHQPSVSTDVHRQSVDIDKTHGCAPTFPGELLVETEDLPEGADIAPCPDAEHEPLPTPMYDQEDGAATEPSDVAAVSDAEIDGCKVTDGEGVVATVPIPAADVPILAPVPERRGRVSTMRRRSARLRRLASATRTPYTRGRGKTLKK
ncbi:Hypothetical predicted protein [Olea europaea subsp. europaea]|uniref:Uncharacterized protein n=1 Tax=Olea europaea subsp. europaea TaxID=158383 RepID=A0A8S0T8B9_OLEEU|nr:Hypothetical predicted protein [Olea europaea subsp. europaea]